MALDPVIKVEITAHNSIMDKLIEDLQRHSIIQIDPHAVKEWESEKSQVTAVSQNILELKKESTEVERAVEFLKGFEQPIPLLKKLAASPEEISKKALKQNLSR